MKKLLTLGLIIVAQSLAAQQIVPVQSGEHDGFTRLVLRIDPEVDWEATTTRGMATIRFPEQALSFATDRVFDRISTDRITGLSEVTGQSASELRLELACQCELSSFAYNGGYIVLDFYDGPALEPIEVSDTSTQWQPDSLPFIQPSNALPHFTPFVMQVAPTQPVLLIEPSANVVSGDEAPDLSQPTLADEPVSLAHGGGTVERLATGSSDIADFENMAGAVVENMNTAVDTEGSPEMLARLKDAQDQLLAQLTRAADQGLVEFVPVPVVETEVENEVPEIEDPIEVAPPVMDPQLAQQLSARTAYGQDTEDALTEIVNQFAMPQCLENSQFLMDGWGGALGFSEQLALLRTKLLGEFDVIDPAVAEAIIQLYLRYGFGAEARLMLHEIGSGLGNAALYTDMADLLEGEPERLVGPVLKGAGCGGAHELWYLASGRGDYQVLEPLSITDIFSQYPIEVRTLIGPPLAHAFIARHQVEAGHVVLEIVRRADGEITAAQRMAEASVLELQSNFKEAEQIYSALALGNDELAPEAMIAYARSLLESGSPVPPTLLVDLEAAAFFYRQAENADALKLWEIKVRAVIEGGDQALQQIVEILDDRPNLNSELQEVAAQIFLQSSSESMGDYRYAQMVLEYGYLLDPGAFGDEARQKMAEEITAIGLPEIAIDVLTPNLSRGVEKSRHTAAAAYVQLYQPAHALDMLENDQSLPAYKIRLSAHLQMENFEAVAQMLSEDFAINILTDDIALRAGDWAQIEDTGAFGTLASYVLSSDGQEPHPQDHPEALAPILTDDAPSLRAARALLAVNQESRNILEDIIATGIE